ncbi:hypothetical protein GCM10010230_62090 [Streptomyces narbonensis]|uniref:hypothetical protein n=1 Tax=Streptomyces narbonensis TaxID=67333 RepID=UPI00167A2EB7|nr:hypothetical protein [Streptomyces narbonensis]GGW10567.1 hypothetical protein GCM10010230_62090 [Streptomyces narbonensis]
MSTFARACAVALVLMVTSTGCVDRPAAGPRSPIAESGDTDTRLTDTRLTDTELTDTDRASLRHAEQVLVARCMRAEGFSYRAGPRPTPDESFTVGYLLSDTAWARRNGYGSRIAARVLAARRTDPNQLYVDGLSPERRGAYRKALDGGAGARTLAVKVPGGGTIGRRLGGCEETAQKQLYGDPATWFRASRTATNLTRLYVSELGRDPEFTAAQAAWAACMRAAGHPYATPADARNALPANREDDRAFAAEVRLATAEAECAGSSGFARAGRALERRYVDGLRGEYGDELDTYARLEREALTRARSLT